MREKRERDPMTASRLEILGAWLRIWTPPRDVEIPPIPWRKVGIGFAGLLAVAALVAVFVAPAIDGSKDRSAAKAQAEQERQQAAQRARQRREQRAHFGRAGGSRQAVLAKIENEIGKDARDRFDKDARTAECDPVTGVDETAEKVAYDCVSGIRDIVGAGAQKGAVGVLAIPFRAVVDFARGTYAFCKVNPPPGEQVIPDPRKIVLLPKACQIPRA